MSVRLTGADNIASVRFLFEENVDLKVAALAYAAADIAVFPVRRDTKRPYTDHGFKDATTDPTVLEKWWDRWPDANIATPVPEGFIVVDFDPRNGGDESELRMLDDKLVVPTVLFMTGGRGWHLWYRLPEGCEPDRLQKAVPGYPGVDTRIGAKHYVIMPPSRHASGGMYAQMCLYDTPVEPIPDRLLALITKPEPKQVSPQIVSPLPAAGENPRYVEKGVNDDLAELRSTPEGGGRHGGRANATFAVACNVLEFVKGGHLDETWARNEIRAAARQTGLPDVEIESALNSAWSRVGPRAVPPPKPGVYPAYSMRAPSGDERSAQELSASQTPSDLHHGQVRFAHRLAEREQSGLRHIHGFGWHYWDGTRWSPDDRGVTKRAVMATLRDEWEEAFNG